MGTDEYNDVYGEELIGVLLDFDGRLSEPEELSAIEVSKLPLTAGNDEVYLHCKPCNTFMKWHEGRSLSDDDKWRCPKCGAVVYADDVLFHLEKFGISPGDNFEADYDDIY